MIKRTIFFALFALYATMSFAEMPSLPNTKEGFMYSWSQNRIINLATIELAKYKGFSIEAGYLGTDGAVGVLSYNIGGLKKLGIDLPILNLIDLNLGIGGGFKTITLPPDNSDVKSDNRVVFGVTATLINIKF